MSQAIVMQGVRKSFGHVVALDGVDLEVGTGEVFGFLGPNGAGKTTAIRVLTGFIKRQAGDATVLGLDAWGDSVETRRRMGYLPDVVAFGPGFTGEGFLSYAAKLRGHRGTLPRQRALLDMLQLSRSALRRKVKGFSTGMAKKLALVQAMQHEPELLVMDEPTEGLDPLMRQELFEEIRRLRTQGVTVFMSSHVLSDVEDVCEHVALIRQGKIVSTGTVDALRAERARVMVVRFRTPPPDGLQIPGGEILSRDGDTLRLAVGDDVNAVVRELARHDLADLVYERLSLEELFLSFYGDGGTIDA